MKAITMTEFRQSPGERLIDVRRDGESFLLTKSGNPVAKLVPVSDMVVINGDGRIHGEIPLSASIHRHGDY